VIAQGVGGTCNDAFKLSCVFCHGSLYNYSTYDYVLRYSLTFLTPSLTVIHLYTVHPLFLLSKQRQLMPVRKHANHAVFYYTAICYGMCT
jgi:hypothetical protein